MKMAYILHRTIRTLGLFLISFIFFSMQHKKGIAIPVIRTMGAFSAW
jgi:hypothetical protein